MIRPSRRSQLGVTLIEAMVAIGVLALIGSLIYGAFDGMSRSRKGITQMSDRYQQGRSAMARMAREIQAAFVSKHGDSMGLSTSSTLAQQARKTAFIGKDNGSFDRLDFTSFAHKQLGPHESDQAEIGYFGSRNRDTGATDLVRREDKYLDMDPGKGGVVNVLVEDVQSLDIEYFDAITREWVGEWDTTQAAGQPWRLPMQVRITLVINGGPGGKPITLRSRVSPAIQTALEFAQ